MLISGMAVKNGADDNDDDDDVASQHRKMFLLHTKSVLLSNVTPFELTAVCREKNMCIRDTYAEKFELRGKMARRVSYQ